MAFLDYAGSAGSYAFSAATAFVFRPDASSSRVPAGLSKSTRRQGAILSNAGSSSSSSSSDSSSPTSSPPTDDDSSSFSAEGKPEGEIMCDSINQEEDLYRILGITKLAKVEDVRRAFLGRSRVCHPDKLPNYPPATPAFQRLSYAYETLSKPASRRMYDLGGGRGYDPGTPRDNPYAGDETLNGVLRNVFMEFLAGDFEMIRVFVNALNEGNPGLNLGEEAVDSLEGAFRRVREVVLNGQKYLRLIKFELIRLYEIQHSMRTLGYFDLSGRLRLTLALTRVTLEIPMVLDRAMRDENSGVPPSATPPMSGQARARMADFNDDGDATGGELARRGILGPRVKGVLVIACKVLEKGERYAL